MFKKKRKAVNLPVIFHSSQFCVNERYSSVYYCVTAVRCETCTNVEVDSLFFIQGVENLSLEQIIVCSNVLPLNTLSGSFLCL